MTQEAKPGEFRYTDQSGNEVTVEQTFPEGAAPGTYTFFDGTIVVIEKPQKPEQET